MTPIEQGIIYVAAVVLGLALSKLSESSAAIRTIGFLNVWIALPGIFLVVYLERGLLAEDLGIAAFGVGFALILLALLAIATRRMAGEARGSVVLSGAIVNAINLPFPMLQVLVGNYTYAATFAAVTSMVQILAAKLLQVRLKTGSSVGITNSLARAAPLVAFVAGIVLHYVAWPASPALAIAEGADDLVTAFIAILFVYFGLVFARSLHLPSLTRTLKSRPFLTTATFRMIVGPLLGSILALPLGVGSGAYLQMVFEATMPPAIANTTLSRIYGFDEGLTASATGILTPFGTLEAVGIFFVLRGL